MKNLAVFGLIFSIFNAQMASALTCESYFNENARKARGVRNLVLLKDGDVFWGSYVCASCDRLTPANPTRDSQRQACHNCAAPHTTEQYIKPELVRRGPNELYLVVTNPEMLQVQLNPAGSKGARTGNSGKKWICGYCQKSNFSSKPKCATCSAGEESALGRFTHADYEGTIGDFSPVGPAAKKGKHGHHVAHRSVTEPDRHTMGSELQGRVDRYRTGPKNEYRPRQDDGVRSRAAKRWQERTKPFLTEKVKSPWFKRSMIAAAGFIFSAAAIFGVKWMTHTYQVEGAIFDQNGHYSVRYEDKDGKIQERHVHLDKGEELILPIREEGEDVILHFRNAGGLKGIERLTGTVFVPGAE